MRQTQRETSQTARVFYLGADRQIVETRDVAFTSRVDLIGKLERDLERSAAIEVWQDEACVLCLKAHGAIETNCGKPAQPGGRRPAC